MPGYTPDEKLRREQLSKLRRQWLKDQELSAREPVIQPKPPGAVAKFWASFLEPKSLWRLYVSTDVMLAPVICLASKTIFCKLYYIYGSKFWSLCYGNIALFELS